jgi:hypothetical protein
LCPSFEKQGSSLPQRKRGEKPNLAIEKTDMCTGVFAQVVLQRSETSTLAVLTVCIFCVQSPTEIEKRRSECGLVG